MRISDWSSDVCSSDLDELAELDRELQRVEEEVLREVSCMQPSQGRVPWPRALPAFVAFKEAFDVAERRQDQADAAERARFAFAMILRCPRHDDGLPAELVAGNIERQPIPLEDRKRTRLNSSH